jgi:2-succinyl-5-enolpyruvyl-6-hydroxy-3-cyclohexene-1-carboxylate synthase
LLSEEFNEVAKPSLVLHLGGRVTSKRVNEFFAQNRPAQYILVKDNSSRLDPIHAVTMHIEADLALFCRSLQKEIKPQQNRYCKFFTRKAQQVEKIIAKNIDDEKTLSEPFVARQISTDIPNNSCLFLSSSMPIRDMDLYGQSGRKAIAVAANRGVSGIDGVISTATGFAAAKKIMTTLVIGDLAFIHDINALATIKTLQLPIVIVVINNHGSGIFHFLPICKCQDVFEQYFAAAHDFSFSGVSETFGIDHCKVTDKADFIDAYRKATKKTSPSIIEVVTDRKSNFTLRRKIKKQILTVLEQEI